jgi:hypothetical protein
MDAEIAERLEKYEAHVKMLEDDLRELQKHRGWIRFVPVGAVLAPFGLLFSPWVALGIALGFVLLAMVAAYLNASRTWYARHMLATAQRDIDLLRSGAVGRIAARELRWWRTSRAGLAARYGRS